MSQTLRNVHDASACAGFSCVVHNPSDHPLREWPLLWRDDRQLMERICPHGVGHPDPDHMAYLYRSLSTDRADAEGVHGCDGCCATAAGIPR